MILNFSYNTYQDVRKNLFRYSVPFMTFTGFFIYWMIFPVDLQQRVSDLIGLITTTPPWNSLLGTGFGIGVFTFIAFIVTEVFKIHDQWYDKHIIKWRAYYDVNYILSRLVRPFASSLNARFYQLAEERRSDFMERLYYPFVGDRDSKIPKNKLVRFYESITIYWLTQINEFLLMFIFIIILIFRITGPDSLEYKSSLLTPLIITTIAFILNRFWIRSALRQVEYATLDEITSIHDDVSLLEDLRNRIHNLCDDYAVQFNDAPQNHN